MKKIIISSLVIVIALIVSLYFLVRNDDSKEAKIINQSENINIQNNLNNNEDSSENINKAKTNTVADLEIKNKIILKGKFNKIDALHYAVGDAKVSKEGEDYKIEFQDNFASANGPDLYVYLSNQENIRNIALISVDTSKSINLGKLQSVNGKQSYLVSKEDFEAHNKSVIIWCKQFRVQFSRADLK